MCHFQTLKIENDISVIEVQKDFPDRDYRFVHIQLWRLKNLLYLISVSLNKNSNTQLKS